VSQLAAKINQTGKIGFIVAIVVHALRIEDNPRPEKSRRLRHGVDLNAVGVGNTAVPRCANSTTAVIRQLTALAATPPPPPKLPLRLFACCPFAVAPEFASRFREHYVLLQGQSYRHAEKIILRSCGLSRCDGLLPRHFPPAYWLALL